MTNRRNRRPSCGTAPCCWNSCATCMSPRWNRPAQGCEPCAGRMARGDIQALIKSGEIVSEIRTEYDSQAQYGQASHHFGGAGVCVRHRRYVAVKAAAEISV